MWHDTEFARRLGLTHPIVQGPFGGGLSSVDLAVAVSEAGGLGSYGAHHLPPDRIGAVAAAIRARTEKPFALNLWISSHDPDGLALSADAYAAALAHFQPWYDALGVAPPAMPESYGVRYEEQIGALLDARPPVFSFVYGIPSAEILAECRKRNIYTLGTATTPDEALALEAAGVDAVVATGMEAGGHRVSFLRSAEESLTGSLALIPVVADALRIPVIAAGGIADARGVAAALTLGAQAVQIGTAFLACAESAASEPHRQKLFSADARYTVLTRAFTGRLARGIRNAYAEAFATRGDDILPYPIQSWFAGGFKAAAIAQGRSDLISLWAGQAAPLLRERSAAALYRSLVDGVDAIRARRA